MPAARGVTDAQPAVSWSVLDHDRVPKAGYEALLEACRPVIVVADRLPAAVTPGEPLALDVHVVSDLRVPLTRASVTATVKGLSPSVLAASANFAGWSLPAAILESWSAWRSIFASELSLGWMRRRM